MTEYSSITIFNLLKFKDKNDLIRLNKGFNSEIEVGLFKMVGYNKERNEVLITKPIEDELAFVVTEQQYKEIFDTLLVFKLNNN